MPIGDYHKMIVAGAMNMLRKVRELYGFAVRATGRNVAWVHDLYFDDEDWRVG